MFKVTVVEKVLPPPEPVTVNVVVPTGAPWCTEICIVDVPEPGAAMVPGEKDTTT